MLNYSGCSKQHQMNKGKMQKLEISVGKQSYDFFETRTCALAYLLLHYAALVMERICTA